jgi:tRNA (guanine-N7-)-methyltransferase
MSEAESKRPGAFFGRRKGHALKARQAALFNTLLPRLALDLNTPAPSDLRALFSDVCEVRLESGFGGGEHLIAEAERQPHVGFVGVEPFINGMAKAPSLEAPLRAGQKHCRDCAGGAARRRVSFRQRYSGLCCLDADAADALAKFRMDRRASG